MSSQKRLAKNMVMQILSALMNFAVSFVLTSFIVERLGEDVYGFVGLANSFTSYITVFTVALNGVLRRYVTIELTRENIEASNVYFSTVSITNLAASIALFIPSILFCFNLELFIDVPQPYATDIYWLWTLIFAAFLFTLSCSTFQVATFARNRLDLDSKRQMQSIALRAILLFAAYSFFKAQAWYVGLATLISALFVGTINIYYTRTLTPELHVKKSLFSWKAFRELVGVGIWNSVNQLSQLLLTGLDLLIANLFLGSGPMGLLSIAKTLPTQFQTFYTMIANVFAPRMTVLYGKEDMPGFLRETRFAMRVCGFISVLPMAGLVVYGPAFFGLWMRELSAESIQQVNLLSIMTLLPSILTVFLYPLYTVNTITTKLKVPVLVSLGIGVATTLGVLLLLQTTSLGIYAIAGVSSVLLIARAIFFTPVYAAHSLKVPLFTFYPALGRGLISTAALVILFYAIQLVFSATSWLTFILMAGVSALIGYPLSFFILFSRQEQRALWALVKNKLKRE